MHPTIVYFKNESDQTVTEVKTQLAFAPELSTTIYHKGVKASVIHVIIDITPPIPAIIIHAKIK